MVNFRHVYRLPPESKRSRHDQAGRVAELLAAGEYGSSRQIRYFQTIVFPAIAHNQIELFYNEDTNAVGAVVWATLAADVEKRVIKTGRIDLHISEWNEGDSLWIVDLVAPFGHLPYILQSCRDDLFLEFDRVCYCRKNATSIRAVEIQRSRMSGILRSMAPLKEPLYIPSLL